jgi:cobalamin transport system substrate-binding protein
VRLSIRISVLLALVSFGWATTSACVTVVDSTHREVLLDPEPRRIVTLAPSLTEIVYFLGLGERVVGVTQFSYYPPQAGKKPKVGSYVDLNVEKIISLSPDLVLGTKDGNQPTVVDLLERAGLPVFIVNPRNIRQVIDTVVTIGRLCGVSARATVLARNLSDEVDRIVGKTASLDKPVVFLQVNPKPIMSVNKHTFTHDLIRLAGGRNMTEDEPITYPRISLEEVIRNKPDVIIISSMARGGHFEQARQQWFKWVVIPAVRNNRVHVVDSDLIDRPSPRIIQGLAAVARLIHPEVNWDE